MPLALTDRMTELVAQRFRLLGEPMRLRILQTLENGELPVSEIVDAIGATQPNVSKHLQVLCQGGLITRRREGLNIYYGIADPMVFKLCRLVCQSAEENARAQLEELSAPSPGRTKRSAAVRR